MFDKMIFNVGISIEKEAAQIAQANHLEAWSNDETKRIEYKSNKSANLNGIFLTIKDGKLQIKCSLHKIYFKQDLGILDNSGLFSMSNAYKALEMLFDYIGIEKERAKITYFEIGLNLPVQFDSSRYIEVMQSITPGEKSAGKLFFTDANVRIIRQKTTEKHKTFKKVFKVYDKEFEIADSRRKPPSGNHILRIETMYRRQSKNVSDFFDDANLKRLLTAFRKDWLQVEFSRTMEADSGIHNSQIEMAKNVLLLGNEAYLQQATADFKAGKSSERKYRTIREFVRDWERNKHKYRLLPSEYEREYKRVFWEQYEKAIK
jgi:hypothetical protein